jgi:hypothetical protein
MDIASCRPFARALHLVAGNFADDLRLLRGTQCWTQTTLGTQSETAEAVRELMANAYQRAQDHEGIEENVTGYVICPRASKSAPMSVALRLPLHGTHHERDQRSRAIESRRKNGAIRDIPAAASPPEKRALAPLTCSLTRPICVPRIASSPYRTTPSTGSAAHALPGAPRAVEGPPHDPLLPDIGRYGGIYARKW